MSPQEIYHVAFMPYLPVEIGFEIGDYKIWSFYDHDNDLIENHTIKEQLKNYFSRYFEFKFDRNSRIHEESLTKIYIISPKDFIIGRDVFSPSQMNDIKSISHIMAFSSIFETGFGAASSDPFVVYIQSIKKGQEGLRVWHKYFTNYRLFKILKPLHIDSPIMPYRNSKLSISLAKSIKTRDANNTIKRILRSVELIFHTKTFGEMITDEHRLLTLVMAFEVLLNFENKKQFVETLEEYIIEYEPIKSTRTINLPGRGEIEVEKSKTCWWAYDLYDLRSQIIHGEDVDWKIDEYGNIWTRIEFAGCLFKRLYKIFLKENNLWEEDSADRILEAFDMDTKLEEIMHNFHEKV